MKERERGEDPGSAVAVETAKGHSQGQAQEEPSSLGATLTLEMHL